MHLERSLKRECCGNKVRARCLRIRVPVCRSLHEKQQQSASSSAEAVTRRQLWQRLASAAAAVAATQLLLPATAAAATADAADFQQLQADAFEAYANRDFQTAASRLTDILQADPSNPRWLEMRAQVLVDSKEFNAALADFNAALTLTPADDPISQARLLSGRALAYEGVSAWQLALDDYNRAIDLAAQGGESPDPYVINARGNCHNSLQDWAAARSDYLTSSQLFQQAKGFRGRGGSTTQRLDGAVFSATNAALMLVAMGEPDQEEVAVQEFERIARRAPGSADTRAALAALYWRDGRPAEAEAAWEFACNSITVGCRKYQDRDWLLRIRRWPPVMVGYLQDFLTLKQPAGVAAAGGRVVAG